MSKSGANLTSSLNEPPRGAEQSPWFYGWLMLPIAMLGMMCTSPGQSFGVSVFRPYMEDQLGIETANFAWAYAVATIVGAMPLLFLGTLMDRYGPRRLLVFVVLLLTLGCVVISQAGGLITLGIGLTMLRMFGQASLGMLSTTTLSLWFNRRLGLANGIMVTGFALAIALVPTLSQGLIEQVGWRHAYIGLGLIASAVMLPLLGVVYRNRPEDVGQRVDGEAVLEHAEAKMAVLEETVEHERIMGSDQPEGSGIEPVSWTLKQAMGTRAFYITACGVAYFALAVTAFTMCMAPIFRAQGYDDTMSSQATATMLWALGLTLMVTQIPAGKLADMVPLNLILSVGCLLMAVPALLLTLPNSYQYLWVIGITLGLSQALIGATGGTLWAKYYGRDHIGKIKGVVSKFFIVASATGPVILDVGHQYTNSYPAMLWVFVIVPLPLGVAALFATKPSMIVDSRGLAVDP